MGADLFKIRDQLKELGSECLTIQRIVGVKEDDIYGPKTRTAFMKYLEQRRNLHNDKLPKETYADMSRYYGKHSLGSDGMPTNMWKQNHLTTITPPYKIKLGYRPYSPISQISCHMLVAESFLMALVDVKAVYAPAAPDARCAKFSGCYNYRPSRGGSELSAHAWGAAVDFDNEANPLKRDWTPDVGMLPLLFIMAFNSHGWKWGGEYKVRPDPMHMTMVK